MGKIKGEYYAWLYADESPGVGPAANVFFEKSETSKWLRNCKWYILNFQRNGRAVIAAKTTAQTFCVLQGSKQGNYWNVTVPFLT